MQMVMISRFFGVSVNAAIVAAERFLSAKVFGGRGKEAFLWPIRMAVAR